MAVACAAAELLGRRQLGLDLVFLIEGEEETGSNGFETAVRRHKVIEHSEVLVYSSLISSNVRILLVTLTRSLSGTLTVATK